MYIFLYIYIYIYIDYDKYIYIYKIIYTHITLYIYICKHIRIFLIQSMQTRNFPPCEFVGSKIHDFSASILLHSVLHHSQIPNMAMDGNFLAMKEQNVWIPSTPLNVVSFWSKSSQGWSSQIQCLPTMFTASKS